MHLCAQRRINEWMILDTIRKDSDVWFFVGAGLRAFGRPTKVSRARERMVLI